MTAEQWSQAIVDDLAGGVVSTYDAAANYQAHLDEIRAARRARRLLGLLRDDLDANDLFAAGAHRLGNILREWDLAPKAILGHEMDPAEGEL